MSKHVFIINVDRCIGCHACSLACRLATYQEGKDSFCSVLELNSEKEKRTIWLPYVCLQVGDKACGPEDEVPPCVKACPVSALIYGDSERKEIKEYIENGKAVRMPYIGDYPRTYYMGKMPDDVAKELPDPRNVIPKKYMPLTKLPP